MNTARVNAAAGVIHAAMQQGAALPVALAYALESAQLLQSPESADELARLRDQVVELEAERVAEVAALRASVERLDGIKSERGREIVQLRTRVAELEADRNREVAAWLAKKAREYRSTRGREHALQADVLERMASKVSRGAIRPTAPAEPHHEGPEHHDYRLARQLEDQ